MSSNENLAPIQNTLETSVPAIQCSHISKCYLTYSRPSDRLRQFIIPRLDSVIGKTKSTYYNEFWSLRDISFNVRKGEVVGIVGKNGSGKSTLLQIICGTLTPTAGVYKVDGRVAALLELGSGFNPEYTGRENIYLNAAVLGLEEKEIEQKLSEIIEFAGIGDFLDRPIKTYSSGMSLRLAFAVAINVSPDILIVDEALAVGDELFQRKCYAKIEELKKSGVTILFVSHSGSTVIDLCDRAILLDAGQLLMDSDPKSVVQSYQRLLYAQDSEKEGVIRDIVSGDSRLLPASAPSESGEIIGEFHASLEEEVFDPNLVTTLADSFPSNGARIFNPSLKTLEGREVNGLVRNKRYAFHYHVQFDEDVSNVRFSMMIKSIKGAHLGGALNEGSAQNGADFKAGDHVHVEYHFDASLNPGVYFVNFGVFGVSDGYETVLHRAVDALAFRILPIESNRSQETFDFHCHAMVNK